MTTKRGNTGKAAVVKPRTAKQRAAAKAFSGSKTGLFIAPAAAPPADSWWTKPKSREEFQQLAAQEQARMRQSAPGRLITAKDSNAVEVP